MKAKGPKPSTPDIMQMQNFAVEKLNARWRSGDMPSGESELSFDYKVYEHPKDERRMRIDLDVRCRPENHKSSGYEIEACIWGAFFFPEGIDTKAMHYLIRVNGAMVLYGLLRGQLATVTGSFPGGKFILPTVDMKIIVADIENKKVAELARAKTKKRALKAPRKKVGRKRAKAPKAATSKRSPKQSKSKTKPTTKKTTASKKKPARKMAKKK